MLPLDMDDPDQAMLSDLLRSNAERLSALAQVGTPVHVQGREGAVLELLVNHLLGNSPERIAFETRWNTLIADQIDQAEKMSLNARITQGAASDLHVIEQLNRSR